MFSIAIRKWLARSTVFAVFFAVTSFILALKGHLSSEYVAVIATLHVSVVGRAIAEDYHERNSPTGDKPNAN